MAENKIYPWAQSSDANVFSDAEYAADVEAGGIYVGGVQTGLASSKQANKTWRQATAPGAGLGQFLVDNLGVDVTDADTPATFSTRIANAVLQLAQISPFNQSWATATGGYRKYAIVSDSSGNFWVSTADQNTTVPGANGANWQSLFNGYATQSWASSAFVKNNAETQGGIVAADMDVSGVPALKSGAGKWYHLQIAGDYATNPALDAEITRAKGVEGDLRTSKADRNSSNTFTGKQIFSGNVVTAGSAHFETYDQAGGNASAVFGAYDPGTGNDNVEAYFNIFNATRSLIQQFAILGSGRLQSNLGLFALVSELSESGYVPNGIYTITRGYASGLAVMTLSFSASISQRNQFVPFGQAFKSPPIINVNNGGGTSSQGGVQIRSYGATALGVYIDIADTLGGVHITARGPV